MKTYSCKVFKNVDDLLKWLNEEQNHINVVSIMYVDSSFHYEVIFYIEEEERVAYQPSNDGYRTPLYTGMYGSGTYNSYQ